MDEDLVDLVARLSAKCTAYEIILIDLVFSTWPLESHRNERRDSTCRALEQQIAQMDPSSHGYLFLQRALAAVEEIFHIPGPPAGGAQT